MSWSMGEIQALCVKAARGAGHPWGIAEEAGWAVRWLAGNALAGPEALARWLDGVAGACPVRLGARIGDTGDLSLAAQAGTIALPLLVLPFLGRAAPEAAAVEVAVGGRSFRVWRAETDLAGELAPAASIGIRGVVPRPAARQQRRRIAAIAADSLARITESAMRTYAPATAASRIRGAGAGLVDND